MRVPDGGNMVSRDDRHPPSASEVSLPSFRLFSQSQDGHSIQFVQCGCSVAYSQPDDIVVLYSESMFLLILRLSFLLGMT